MKLNIIASNVTIKQLKILTFSAISNLFISKLNIVVNNVTVQKLQNAACNNIYILFMKEFNIIVSSVNIKSKENLYKHVQYELNIFVRKPHLNRHTDAMHEEIYYPCDNCDYLPSGKSILRSH